MRRCFDEDARAQRFQPLDLHSVKIVRRLHDVLRDPHVKIAAVIALWRLRLSVDNHSDLNLRPRRLRLKLAAQLPEKFNAAAHFTERRDRSEPRLVFLRRRRNLPALTQEPLHAREQADRFKRLPHFVRRAPNNARCHVCFVSLHRKHARFNLRCDPRKWNSAQDRVLDDLFFRVFTDSARLRHLLIPRELERKRLSALRLADCGTSAKRLPNKIGILPVLLGQRRYFLGKWLKPKFLDVLLLHRVRFQQLRAIKRRNEKFALPVPHLLHVRKGELAYQRRARGVAP